MALQGTKTENGSCLCGRIRYKIQTEAKRQVVHCHCTICRRASGALFVTWVTVLRSGFEWICGDPQVFRSSPPAQRLFCGDCGTPLVFQHDDSPLELDVTAGSLEDCSKLKADHHIFAGSKLKAIHVDEHLPSYKEDTPVGWKRTSKYM